MLRGPYACRTGVAGLARRAQTNKSDGILRGAEGRIRQEPTRRRLAFEDSNIGANVGQEMIDESDEMPLACRIVRGRAGMRGRTIGHEAMTIDPREAPVPEAQRR